MTKTALVMALMQLDDLRMPLHAKKNLANNPVIFLTVAVPV